MLNDADVWGMVHHNLVVKGPLFPLFPEGWEGPQARYGGKDRSWITSIERQILLVVKHWEEAEPYAWLLNFREL